MWQVEYTINGINHPTWYAYAIGTRKQILKWMAYPLTSLDGFSITSVKYIGWSWGNLKRVIKSNGLYWTYYGV